MNYLILPVKFSFSDYEEVEKYDNLGLKYEEDLRPGVLKVAKHHIVAWNEDSEGFTTLYLTNGSPWKIYLPVEEFEQVLND